MVCETLGVNKIRCFCFPIWRFFWLGWVTVRRNEPEHLYYDSAAWITVYSEDSIRYVTIGFTKSGVMERLRRYVATIREEEE